MIQTISLILFLAENIIMTGSFMVVFASYEYETNHKAAVLVMIVLIANIVLASIALLTRV